MYTKQKNEVIIIINLYNTRLKSKQKQQISEISKKEIEGIQEIT